jgi:magnesium-protoporphyrin O-methyltransferase
MLAESRVRAETLLDVGGGIGVLAHEFLAAGRGTAVEVEVAGAYLEAARNEAARRGHSDRLVFRQGDAVDLAPDLLPADLVTLDRVLCCYPDLQPLLQATADKARRYWAGNFPRERWFIRLRTRWENARRARAGNQFRTYVHPVSAIYSMLRQAGLTPLRIHRGPFWESVVCIRQDGSGAGHG